MKIGKHSFNINNYSFIKREIYTILCQYDMTRSYILVHILPVIYEIKKLNIRDLYIYIYKCINDELYLFINIYTYIFFTGD